MGFLTLADLMLAYEKKVQRNSLSSLLRELKVLCRNSFNVAIFCEKNESKIAEKYYEILV
jgi:CRISPR/Cas system CMR-associated protein Cmr3 (group 5 of RAMP superfamily)